MKAKDLMTKDVVAVDKNDRITAVLELMVKHRVSKLVVVEGEQAVGIITDGDIADELGALKNKGVAPSALHASSAMRKHFATAPPDAEIRAVLDALAEEDAGIVPIVHDRTLVGVITGSDALSLVQSTKPLADVMTAQLHVVAPSDRVIHARRTMLDHHVERLPVLDHGKLVGMLGEVDIALGFAKLKDTIADRHQPAALQRFLVQDIMHQTLITATPETTAKDAVALMRRHDVGSLPVLRGERVVGIVTRTDLLKLIPR